MNDLPSTLAMPVFGYSVLCLFTSYSFYGAGSSVADEKASEVNHFQANNEPCPA
jgi:hypothetical protein